MITVNLDKAKQLVHDQRRALRTTEFAPLDQRIAAVIPGDNKDALEAARQEIRDRHAKIQTSVIEAKTVDELLGIVNQLPNAP